MKRWTVGLIVGIWVIVFVMIAVRYVNTGRMSDTSTFVAVIGVGGLLSLASHVPRRRVVRWLFRFGASAAIAVAAYVYFRGAH